MLSNDVGGDVKVIKPADRAKASQNYNINSNLWQENDDDL